MTVKVVIYKHRLFPPATSQVLLKLEKKILDTSVVPWFFLFYVLVFKIFGAVGALCMFSYF